MLQINFDNLYKIAEQNQKSVSISQKEHQKLDKDFDLYKEKILGRNQGWITYPFESFDVVEKIEKFVKKTRDKYKFIVILGIGGSSLGNKTLNSSLKKNRNITIYVSDNIDPYTIYQIDEDIEYSKTLFIVQAKSGETPETLAQYFYFRERMEAQGLDPKEHLVFITDAKKGYLRKVANQENIPTFEIPENIGGRYSVLTPIGLLGACFAGINIKELLNGAGFIAQNCFLEPKNLNIYKLASAHFLLAEKKQTNLVIMPYTNRLKTLGEWAIQLYSESSGKEFDNDGKKVNSGITPIPSVGATDQHSQLQLFKEGIFDKQIVFIEVKDHQREIKISSNDFEEEPSFQYLKDITFQNLLQAEFEGTRQSLTESFRPNITITIDKVDEWHLGALFMAFQLATAFTGEMMNINPFNQPGVERSKQLTREILLKNKY